MNLISKVINLAGLDPTAKACGRTYQAVRKWEAAGRFPRSEHMGQTNYSGAMERLTHGEISKQALLDWSLKGWREAA